MFCSSRIIFVQTSLVLYFVQINTAIEFNQGFIVRDVQQFEDFIDSQWTNSISLWTLIQYNLKVEAPGEMPHHCTIIWVRKDKRRENHSGSPSWQTTSVYSHDSQIYLITYLNGNLRLYYICRENYKRASFFFPKKFPFKMCFLLTLEGPRLEIRRTIYC